VKIILPILVGVAGLSGFTATAGAQTDNRERLNRVIVYGNDPCPRGSGDEIVVCARRPDNDRYRIPEELRREGQPESESWAARAESLETIGDTGIQSCSTVGPGGFTGCWAEMMRQARQAKRNPQPRR